MCHSNIKGKASHKIVSDGKMGQLDHIPPLQRD